jgi:hypothetical protein
MVIAFKNVSSLISDLNSFGKEVYAALTSLSIAS